MKKSSLPLQNVRGTDKQKCAKDDLMKLLRWHFGHSEFRGTQLEAIEAALSGRDCFCLMPTGGGKSTCYQIPALANSGFVLVVCPLIALMENQVSMLKEKGIAAEYLSSTQSSRIREKVHEALNAEKPSLRLLYVTPELIATSGFMSKLIKIHARGLLSLIAIDEAHCISTWGHDFRPSYRKLAMLRSHLPGIPILALTATAVPKVQKDVIESLGLQNPLVLKSSFNRQNIFYEVRYKDLLNDPYVDLGNLLKSTEGTCAIVYCLERATCDDLAIHLSKKGISCAAYHAGLNNKLRTSVLEDWILCKTQVVVATVAFGMGIDRKGVRLVCHFNIPKSMEAFYQESGRAGRDQLPSRSILYYGMDDRKRMEFILNNAENKKLQSSSLQDSSSKKSLADFRLMVEYCEESGCRRKKILESFGEQVPASLCKQSCDACKHPNLVSKCLEEVTSIGAVRHRNTSSHILISSPSNFINKAQFSEFWNGAYDASGSEEDISDSDDGFELCKGLDGSKVPSDASINDRIDQLQHAEEKYYHNKMTARQVNKHERSAISEILREASKKRLLTAVGQIQQRLIKSGTGFETFATFLENECYSKYGKTGKSFYLSQVASTVRWLSSANSNELTNRLQGNSFAHVSETAAPREKSPTSPSISKVGVGTTRGSFGSEVPLESLQDISREPLPYIPSFADFINSRKRKESPVSTSEKQVF